jgi:hypothetical protein
MLHSQRKQRAWNKSKEKGSKQDFKITLNRKSAQNGASTQQRLDKTGWPGTWRNIDIDNPELAFDKNKTTKEQLKMANQFATYISPDSPINLEDIDKAAKRMGLNRSTFILEAARFYADLDNDFLSSIGEYYCEVSKQSGVKSLPIATLLQRLAVMTLAERQSESDVYGGSMVLFEAGKAGFKQDLTLAEFYQAEYDNAFTRHKREAIVRGVEPWVTERIEAIEKSKKLDADVEAIRKKYNLKKPGIAPGSEEPQD